MLGVSVLVAVSLVVGDSFNGGVSSSHFGGGLLVSCWVVLGDAGGEGLGDDGFMV